MLRSGRHILFWVSALALCFAVDVHADIIYVPSDQPTIQAAIDEALDGDEIVVAPGTYFENINFLGKAVTLRSSGGPEDTIIHAGGSGSVVTCNSSEESDTVLDGFTITGGSGTLVEYFPGKFLNLGGGILNLDGDPSVSNCFFIANSAQFGAGMFNDGDATLVSCTFSGNVGEFGAGLYNGDNINPTVANCIFCGNTAQNEGGGMINSGGSPTIINCTFSGNTSGASGGGMFNVGVEPTVTNCTFIENSANFGGAMSAQSGSHVEVFNCILWNNSPDEIAGGGTQVTYSAIEGGFEGGGNIDAAPLFVDPDGADNIMGTPDDDLRLLLGSPCIDAGDNDAVPVGVPTDLGGNQRFADDHCTDDTGFGDPPVVDMGAFEFQDCQGDIDCDSEVDVVDLLTLLASWGPCVGCDADLNGDHKVGAVDLLTLLAGWGACQ